MKAGKGAAKAEDSVPFTIKAFNSEYPEIHMQNIVASNGKFFIGNMTGSVCPRGVRDCPVGNVTALQTTKEGYAYLVRFFHSCTDPVRDEEMLITTTRMSSTKPKSSTLIPSPDFDSIHRECKRVKTPEMPHSP